MLTYSREEKNDILIEKFFLGYPSSLIWAQHLSRADKFRFHFLKQASHRSCWILQSFPLHELWLVCFPNCHPNGISFPRRESKLLRFWWKQTNPLHSPTHWFNKWGFHTKAQSSLGNREPFLGWAAVCLTTSVSQLLFFLPRRAPFIFSSYLQ